MNSGSNFTFPFISRVNRRDLTLAAAIVILLTFLACNGRQGEIGDPGTPANSEIPSGGAGIEIEENLILWNSSSGVPLQIQIADVERWLGDDVGDSGLVFMPYPPPHISPQGFGLAVRVMETGATYVRHPRQILVLIDEDGGVSGAYSAPFRLETPCFLIDFGWMPGPQAAVLTHQVGTGCDRLMLIEPDGDISWGVSTFASHSALYVSPDARWAALDQSWREGDAGIIEFIPLNEVDGSFTIGPDDQPIFTDGEYAATLEHAKDVSRAWADWKPG